MTSSNLVIVSAAVEGPADEAVLHRLADLAGLMLGTVYGKRGKQQLLQRLGGYNQAARRLPWVVLVDLDADADCAVPFRASWLPKPSAGMCFRVAVREVEAWLLADREHIATFLSVPLGYVPSDPEALPNPKQTVVSLAARSRRRDIREDLVPRPGSGRVVGPAYTSGMIEFTERDWRPDVAAQSADSLRRCVDCLRRLRQQWV